MSSAPATPSPRSPAVGESQLESSQGKTTVADVVVSKIAGMAARDVSGVHSFGGGTTRAIGALRERIPGARASSTQGVTVEVGEKQAAIDLVLVVEYGVAIAELARGVRRNVIDGIEQMTGLEVVEVNIHVTDLHLPGDDTSEQSSTTGRVE
ncbi:Asp23/Gls24 family envelope stress response protein [Saccharopolyspora sp. NPDC050642]|uniref:Asp23/Gls24 family envelope stress response protein n=1 Tax=Saccharopolyspora sp. NPDC050642 TaxID=3157099 RepID=UPI0033C5A355